MLNFLLDIINDLLESNIVLIFEFDFIFLIIKSTIFENLIGSPVKKCIIGLSNSKLSKYNISIQRLIQIPNNKTKTASIVIITHDANEKDSSKCLNSLIGNKNILKNPVKIRLF